MNKVLLAAGLLSVGVAFGQQTTKSSSTTSSTSSYNNYNTGNYNSQDATSGMNSSTGKPTSTTANPNRMNKRKGTMNSSSPSSSSSPNGTSYNGDMNNMGTSTAGSTSGTPTVDGSAVGTGTGTYNSTTIGTTTTGSYNGAVGTSTAGSTSGYNSGATTPATTGSTYDNTATATGTSVTTPATNGSYNNNLNSAGGTSVTTTDVYSTQTRTNARPERTNDYKNFAYGIYVGVNTTKFKGEALDANGAATALTGRLGYQAGFFVRGGGRLYGQIGAEYFASSSNYFTAGSGQSAASIADQINIKYIQVPVYIGYKLTESDRGISAVRVQLGVEYANQIGSSANRFGNLNNFEVKSGTFNGLGQLGFDAGPVFLDLTYHYGFSNAIQQNAGFAGSQRRILSASLGFKF